MAVEHQPMTIRVHHLENSRSQRILWLLEELELPYEITRYERSEEHTSELQSLMRISYAVFCLKKKKQNVMHTVINIQQHTQRLCTNHSTQYKARKDTETHIRQTR